MRLCIIANPNSIHVQRWVRYFSSRHEVHLIGIRRLTTTLPGTLVYYDITKTINIRKLRYVVWALEIRRLLASIEPDVLHAHFIPIAGWLGAVSGFHPFMVTAHGSDVLILPRDSLAHRILTKLVLKRADYITCVSANLKKNLLSLGVTEDKLEVLHLGIDTTIHRPSGDQKSLRANLGFDSDLIVLSLRPFRPIYDPLSIAYAIPKILGQAPSTRFIVFTYDADDELLLCFKKYVKDHGAESSVTYIASLSDEGEIARFMQVADIGVSVALSDGTPISVLEAMACNTAMVLGEIPAYQGWLRDEEEALLVPVRDYESLSNAIVRLLQDEDLRRKLSRNASSLVREQFNKEIWMERAEQLYQTLISSSG